MTHTSAWRGPTRFKRVALAGALALLLAAGARAAPNWPAAPYSYYAKNESLQTTLRQFAGGFSLALELSPGVSGTVNGDFNANTPTEFMDKLGGVYGFNWFVHAGTLFVSPAKDTATRSISAMGSSITALHDALMQLGVLDARFGWGELPDQGLALVSGPPAYVDLVQQTVAALPLGAGGQQVAVFRLKHASVNDRTVSYRTQNVVTPGLATVLRNLILGAGGGNNNQSLAAIAAPLRDNPPSFNATGAGGANNGANAANGANSGGNGAGDAGGNGAGNGTSGNGAANAANAANSAGARAHMAGGLRLVQPTVQADPRLNAIIVQDIPDRIPIYRQLIEQLDVPSTLIEIEAMIVDVNSDLVHQLGVTWGGQAGKWTLGYGDFGLTTSNGLPLDSATGVAPGTLGISVGNSLAARLTALQSTGQAHILSQPSILTADNMGAVIDLSSTFYIQSIGERVATVTPVTVGTSLRVTPRYIEGLHRREVELTVDVEDGSVQYQTTVSSLPTVNTSTISTLAIVGDDETLLVGGYNNSQDSEQLDKMPVLGDVPVFGALFSNRNKTVQRSERLFLLRPRVVSIDGEPVAMPRGQSGQQEGAAQNATGAAKEGQATSAGQYLDAAQGQQTRVRFESDADGAASQAGPTLRVETGKPANVGEGP